MTLINCIQNILKKKEILPFACFWLIGVAIIIGRCCYDLKTYFFGDTLVYRFVSQSGYDYLLHLPVGFSDFGGKRPLLIYLHGKGEIGNDNENKKSVLLEPSKWIGKKFPLLQFLEDSDIDKILTSNQNIVLFRFDCDECKQMIEKIQDKDHYVFIAIPSEKNNEVLFSLPEYLTLPDKYEWWVETPVVFALENGTVKKVFNMIE